MEALPSSYSEAPEHDVGAFAAPATSPVKAIKRRRLRACNGCRQRKIRCDDNPASCRNCEVYQTDCFITRDGVKKPRSRMPMSIRNRVGPPTSKIEVASLPRTQALYDASVKPQSRHTMEEPDSTMANETYSPSDSAQMQTSPFTGSVSVSNSDMIQGVVVTETGPFPRKSKYTGMSSGQVLAKSAEELFKHQVPHVDVMSFFCPLMSFGEEMAVTLTHPCPLVDKDTADKCVNNFFSTFHVLFPILNPGAFFNAYESFYRGEYCNDPSQIACVLLVIALGANHHNDSTVHTAHFAAAWAMYHHLISSPYIGSIQALILLTLDLMNSNKDGQAILSIGSAIRIAQSIGLHRSLAAHKHPHEKEFVRKEHNLRSSIWWICYCLDKKLCFEGGRPSGIFDDDCDADLPDFEDIDVNSPASVRASASISPSSFFRHFIGICQILSSITSNLFRRSSTSQSEAAILSNITLVDEKLLIWKGTLPGELQPEQELAGVKDGITYVGAALLHCVYHNAMLVVHRASLLGEKTAMMRSHHNPRIFASDTLCLNAARSLARSVNDWVSSISNLPINRWTISYSTNAVFVLYIAIMKFPSRWSSEMDLALMKSMDYCLQQNSDDIKVIENFKYLLQSLCSAIDTVKNKVAEPTGVDTHNDAGSNAHDVPIPAGTGFPLKQRGEVQASTGAGKTSIRQSEYGDIFTDVHSGMGASMNNFHFEDFFGDDPNTFNMQFWPMEFAGNSMNVSE